MACKKAVYISTTPAGATVTELQKKVIWGTTPLNITQPDGKYKIKIELKDVATEIVSFEIKDGINSQREKLKDLQLKTWLVKRQDRAHWVGQVYYLRGMPVNIYRLLLNDNGTISFNLPDQDYFGSRVWSPNWGSWSLKDGTIQIKYRERDYPTYVFKLHDKDNESYATKVDMSHGGFPDWWHLVLYR